MLPNTATANADVYSVEKEDTGKKKKDAEHIHPDAVTVEVDIRHTAKNAQYIKEREWLLLSKAKQIQQYLMPEI